MKSDFELSDFIITSPYPMTTADTKAIDKASGEKPKAEDWNHSALKSFKERVRSHYRKHQNQKCVYCRMDVSKATSYFHIEHIVPKSVHPEWMYEPLNLCVACANCNSAKNNQEVLSDANTKSFPTESSGYLIIHPHFDHYFEHIEIVDGLLYKGLTPKGVKTIEICNLTRVDLLVERAKLLIQKDNEQNPYSKLMITYTLNSMWIGDMGKLLKEIQELMKMLEVAIGK